MPEKNRNYGETPNLADPLPEDIQTKLEQGKKERTMVLLGAEAPPSGRTTPYAKTYVRIQFDNEDNLLKCVKLLQWSDERLKKLPELLNMWCWYRTYREGMNVYFSTWWWNQHFFEERKQAFLERSHRSFLEMFGATTDNVTVEHELVGIDQPFHYWEKNMPIRNTVSISISSDPSSAPKKFSDIPWYPGITVLQAMIIAQSMNPGTFSFRAVYHSSYGAFIDQIDDIADADPKYWLFSVNNAPSPVGVSEAIVLESGAGINVEVEWMFGLPSTPGHEQQRTLKASA